MDNIITHILEIDQRAKDKLEDAHQQKENIINSAKAEEERIQSDMQKKVDERLSKVEECEKADSDEKIAELEKEKDLKIKQLDDIFNENRETWVENIVSAVLEQSKS